MDGQLGEVLREERHETHELAEDEGTAEHVERVVDAERVENGRQKHILPDKRAEASTLEIWLEQCVA